MKEKFKLDYQNVHEQLDEHDLLDVGRHEIYKTSSLCRGYW